jgi:hypothetical protein
MSRNIISTGGLEQGFGFGFGGIASLPRKPKQAMQILALRGPVFIV